jgi:anaerobic selenocysteine-containing dehydrogenase
MSESISRREFLKIIGLGTAISAGFAPGGPLIDSVSQDLFSQVLENPPNGKKTSFATTCGACSAGCGLIVHTKDGQVDLLEGNPQHPLNRGKTCARRQASLDALHAAHRMNGPVHQSRRGSGNFETMNWEAAIRVVKAALQLGEPGGTAFLMGLFPDHLFDLVQMLANTAGTAVQGMRLLRYGVLGEFEGRVTLMDAAQRLFGASKLPYFDIQHAAVTFSFGANFTESWMSPVAYTRLYELMRQQPSGGHGYLVQFEPRRSQTAAAADEWIPIRPGTEAIVAMALARLVGALNHDDSLERFNGIGIAEAAQASGIPEADLHRLARIFANAPRKLAIPGGSALGSAHGLAAAEAILALNILANNLGQAGGLFFTPDFPVNPGLVNRPSTLAEISALVEQMRSGQINVLFVHNANPAFDLPAEMGFVEALARVPLVISFASFPDETALLADYVLPDHTPLESWGYQKVAAGGDRLVVSGLQPVIAPLYDTRATVDVLLAAVQSIGGDLAAALPFQDEVDFLQKSIVSLIGLGGFYPGTDWRSFWLGWRQYGGWWDEAAGLCKPEVSKAFKGLTVNELTHNAGDILEYPFHLLIFPYFNLDRGHLAGSSGSLATPDPQAKDVWQIWAEINPLTAKTLGVRKGDVVKISSSVGEIEAFVYETSAILPDVIAVPLWQGRSFLDDFAERQVSNPLKLLELIQNNSGNLAFMGTRVKVMPLHGSIWNKIPVAV